MFRSNPRRCNTPVCMPFRSAHLLPYSSQPIIRLWPRQARARASTMPWSCSALRLPSSTVRRRSRMAPAGGQVDGGMSCAYQCVTSWTSFGIAHSGFSARFSRSLSSRATSLRMRFMRRVERVRRNATAQDAKRVRPVSAQSTVVSQSRTMAAPHSDIIWPRTNLSRLRMTGPPSARHLRSTIRLSSLST